MDEVALSIRAASKIASDLHALYTQTGDKLHELWGATNLIRRIDQSEDLIKLQERIDRLQELRRMAEAGEFKLQVAQVMDAAWKRLP